MPPITLPKPIGRDLMIFTAHPAGVEAIAREQMNRAREAFPQGLPGAVGKNALVIGSTSLGYGSATVQALKAAGFNVYGVGFEVPPQIDTSEGAPTVEVSSTGWYLTRALHQAGIVKRTYLADAFADATRERVIGDLRSEGIGIDLVVNSLAAGARTYNGQTWRSVLGVIGDPVELMALKFNVLKPTPAKLERHVVEAATEAEIEATRRVMGGEDLELWIGAMFAAGVLNPGVIITSRTYIGPPGFDPLRRLYWDGSIGAAKKDVDTTMRRLNALLAPIQGRAFSEVDPAVVTVASAQIPAIAKYIAAYLAVVSGGTGKYLDPLSVAIKLVNTLFNGPERLAQALDSEGRLRLDDNEMNPDLQAAIGRLWADNDQEGVPTEVLLQGVVSYKEAYLKLFGFGVPGVDYSRAVEFDLAQPAGVVNLLTPAANAAPAAVLDNPLDSFFNVLLARDAEAGVRREDGPKGKPVYVMEVAPDAARVAAYSAVVGHTDAGTWSPALTFASAFPAIMDAIKDVVRRAPRKTVVHESEEIEIVRRIDPMAPVTVRVKQKRAKDMGEGVTLVMIEREIQDAQGETVSRGLTTLIIGAPIRASEPKWEDLPQEGFLEEKTFDQSSIDGYRAASGDNNPIHWDSGVIHELGMKAPLAHGAFFMAVGSAGLPGGYTASFMSPVYSGERVRFFRMPDGQVIGFKVNPDDGSKGSRVIGLIPQETSVLGCG